MSESRTAPSMRLADLLSGFADPDEVPDRAVRGVAADSAQTGVGTLFLALRGARRHGLEFYSAARAAGATAVAFDPSTPPPYWPEPAPDCPLIAVDALAERAASIADRFYLRAARRPALVGITGTDGKTSCAGFIAQSLARLQTPSCCGLLGTLGGGVYRADDNGIADGIANGIASTSAPLTTPDAVSLRRWLADCAAAGAASAVMEVSSHALAQGRCDGLPFRVAVLTQLSRDHLDYHGSVAAYAAAKRRLFTDYRPAAAVLNFDDPFGRRLGVELRDTPTRVYGYGLRLPAAGATDVDRLWASSAAERDGLRLRVAYRAAGVEQTASAELRVALLGRFNASNVLATICALLALDVPFVAATSAAAALRTVAGRMETLTAPGRPLAVVDYAHTPHALEQALRALRDHADGGELWCVFGCGGDRDRGKRPLMGAAAERWADRCVVTNDNPRGEDPAQIAAQTLAGMTTPRRATVELDRAAAIRGALTAANASDTVLIAGKGHEDYQIVAGERRAFSDRAVVRDWLERAA